MVDTFSQEEFMDMLLMKAGEVRQPLYGLFELTPRCNLSCRMCYINLPAGHPIRNKELSPSQWIKIAKEAVDEGMVFVTLSGGEVFLRRDFFEIYEPLTRLGVFIIIYTNGNLITRDIASRLAESPPLRVEVSLYGATERTYEEVTQIPGSFARCLRGIEALLEYNIPVLIKSTLTRQNIAELEAMRRLAHGYGVPFLSAWVLTKRRDQLVSKVEECRIPPSEGVQLEASDEAVVKEWQAALLRGVGDASQNFYCSAGKSYFVINSLGEMNACVDLPFPKARPLAIGFRKAWEMVQRFVDFMSAPSHVCQKCEVRALCPRCPAWSYLETGTFTEPVPYLCEIALERKKRYAPNIRS
jgi:radical SAM protein with 4Fe4S-binding SPASM domain